MDASASAARAEALHVRAHLRRDRGQLWRAIRDFKRAARLAPQDFRNYYCRAVARRLRRDWKAALRDLEEALRRSPGNAFVLNYRGLMHLELGRLDEALADYERVLQQDRSHFDAAHNRGVCLERRGEPRGAGAAYTDAIPTAPHRA